MSRILSGPRLRIFLAAALCVFLSGPAAAEETLKKVRFIPLWKPQAQFAGYYLAQEKGIYRKYGLDVVILDGGPDAPPARLLADGRADVAVMWLASGIRARAEGAGLVNIGQMLQRSGMMLVARRSSGIRSLPDLNGKRVGLWEGDLRLAPEALFRTAGLAVTAVAQSETVTLFLRGGVDAASAMWYNEYHTIIDSGVNPEELITFFLRDHGFDFPEDGLYVTADTFARDARMCRDFSRASIEGWMYAFAHPQEAVAIVLERMKKANVPANRVHQAWMLEKLRDLVIPGSGEGGIGLLRQDDYERVAAELKKAEMISVEPDFTVFYPSLSDDAK